MLTLNGLAKLAEECGELMQVVGKKIAYYDTDSHPDNAGSLKLRMEDEMADVMAAIDVVIQLHQLDATRIVKRRAMKRLKFHNWACDPDV